MGIQLDQPQPLKGPIGLRDLLFIRVLNRDALRVRGQWGSAIMSLLAATGACTVLCLVFNEYKLAFASNPDWWNMGRIIEDFWYIAMGCAVIAELVSWFWAFNTLWFELPRWRRRGRLDELSLTLLRPVTIGQLIISRSLLSCYLFWGGVLFGGSLGLVYIFPQAALFLWPLLLIALNGLVSFYAFSWVALTLGMALRPLPAALAYLMFLLSYSLMVSVLMVGIIGVSGALVEIFRWKGDMVVGSWLLVAPGLVVIVCAIKLLFARAYAAKFEGVVFPQLDF